jgi:AraC-like DNA-binding protein
MTTGRPLTRFGQVAVDPLRAPMSTNLVVKLAAQHGIPETTILAGTGLTASGLRSPHAEVTRSQELAAIVNLLAATPQVDSIGLDAGLRYHLTTYGIWGFAMVSAATFREAMDVGLRYLELTYTFAPIRAEDRDNDLVLVLEEDPDLAPEITRFLVQRDAAAIHTLQRETMGYPTHPRSVSFRQDATDASMRRSTEIFGHPPTFGADRNVVVLDAGSLDVPLPQADEHTAAMTQQMCHELLDARRSRSGLAGRVRDLVVARLRQPPTLDDIAQLLHLSPRTLRRRLSDEGTSLRQLIDEVRATLAAELMRGGRLTVAEVARRLGYLEVSSFSQAFRRWYGVSPRAYQSQDSS